MVKHFLSSQKRRLLGQTRQNLASAVAATFDRGQKTAQNIVHWEKSWVTDNKNPSRKRSHKEAENYELWMSNEDVTMAV